MQSALQCRRKIADFCDYNSSQTFNDSEIGTNDHSMIDVRSMSMRFESCMQAETTIPWRGGLI